MDKPAVRTVLEQIAALLELKGEGPAAIKAAQDAAAREITTSGRSSTLDELRELVPPGLVDLLGIPGLGVTRVRQIHETLDIETVGELEAAAEDGRLAALPRFGRRTVENVRRGIAALRHGAVRLQHHARDEARRIREALAALPGVRRVEIAGSLRRGCELIEDLAFVAVIDDSEVGEPWHEVPGVTVVRATADGFGLAWIRATGSAAHVAQLEARAALGGGASWPDEERVYRAAGLPWIPPELREGSGEIAAAAAGELPRIVEQRDLQGFLHCHTNYSDGSTTVADWAAACRAAGYRWVGITDHSPSAVYAAGLAAEDIPRQHAEIDALNKISDEFRVLKGVEADILADGSLDYGPAVLESFDFVIASIHTRFGMTEAQMTGRVLRAMDDPHLTILGHPTGRLLLTRDPYAIDLDRVLARAAELGVAVELNADPHRLDLDWRLVRKARDLGVAVSLGADAHSIGGMANVEAGLGMARKGWLERCDLLNTLDADAFLARARRRREAYA